MKTVARFSTFLKLELRLQSRMPEDLILKTVESLVSFFEIEVGPTERAEGIIQTVVHFSTFANQKLRPWSAQKACFYRQLYVLASFSKKKLGPRSAQKNVLANSCKS